MADTLYSAAILRLKLAGEGAHRLPAPGGSAARVSPVCGSKIVADVVIGADGTIAALALDGAKSCTLGQASAAVVAQRAAGMDAAGLGAVRAELADYLAGRSESAPEGWAIFAPARPHRARHPSIVLPLDAVLAAVAAAAAAA